MKLYSTDIDELLQLGISKEKIAQKLNGEQLISEEIGAWLLEKEILKNFSCDQKETRVIQSFVFDSEKYHLEDDWESNVFLDYLFLKGEIDLVEEALDLYHILSELYRIPLFNDVMIKYLPFSIHPFYLQNFSVINKIFDDYMMSIVGEDLLFESKIHLSRQEVIECVIGYLEKLDNITEDANLKNDFLNGLAQGNIILLDKDDILQKEKILKENDFSKEKLECACFFNSGNQLFINVPLNGNLEDIYAIVHEFFHKYAYCGNGYSFIRDMHTYKLLPFDEFPSIYFENYLISYLIELGFSKEEVLANHKFRKHNNIDIYAQTKEIWDLVKIILEEKRKISLNDFKVDYTKVISEMKEIFLEVGLEFSENQKSLLQKLEKENDGCEALAKSRCDKMLRRIMFDLSLSHDAYSYLFSAILTSYFFNDSEELVAWMLRFSKGMTALDMAPIDVVQLLLPAYISILFQCCYEDCGIKRIPMLVKTKN